GREIRSHLDYAPPERGGQEMFMGSKPKASRYYQDETDCMRPKSQYLLSLPERLVRSASALAAGLVREIGNITLPKRVRRTRLYQTMVETTLRFHRTSRAGGG